MIPALDLSATPIFRTHVGITPSSLVSVHSVGMQINVKCTWVSVYGELCQLHFFLKIKTFQAKT